MQGPVAGMLSDVVEKVRERERVVPVEGRIRVGGARAAGVSFVLSFLCFCLNCRVSTCMNKRRGIAAQRAKPPDDCVDGESLDGDGKSLVRKKQS